MAIAIGLRDAPSTRNKILDACEQIYAEEGIEGLTLRVITEKASVNLASVNYHFGTKEVLVGEMLKRQLTPLHAERLSLLKTVEKVRPNSLRPTHVLSTILLPVMRMSLTPSNPRHLMDFFMRCSSDPSPLIRQTMAAQFEDIGKQFDEAFIRSAPKMMPDDIIWRSRIFFNSFPGTIANQNTITMLRNMMHKHGTSCRDVLMQFGSVVECITHGRTDDTHMKMLANDILQALSDTPTVHALRMLMPLD